MANFSVLLKQEISRIARKEARALVGPLQKAMTARAAELAELRRTVREQERVIRQLQREVARASAQTAALQPEAELRFSAKRLTAQRERLQLTPTVFGKLVGVPRRTISAWERGAERPSPEQLAAIAELRKIGKAALQARLAELSGR